MLLMMRPAVVFLVLCLVGLLVWRCAAATGSTARASLTRFPEAPSGGAPRVLIGDQLYHEPQGIALDGQGNVYVADAQNRRVYKLSPALEVLAEWSAPRAPSRTWSGPRGVAVDASGDVYVADTEGHRVLRLSSTLVPLAEWGGQGTAPGQFTSPMGVAIDRSGHLYVADWNNHRIQRLPHPRESGAQWEVVAFGPGPGRVTQPTDVAVDSTGAIYVAEPAHDRIQEFSADGNLIVQWARRGPAPGQFLGPASLAVDLQDYIYVGEWARIQKLSPEGEPVAVWGTRGCDPGQVRGVSGIAIGRDGSLSIADGGNYRIQQLSASGALLGQWGIAPTLHCPSGVAVAIALSPGANEQGDVYVTDKESRDAFCGSDQVSDRVQRFTADGQLLGQWLVERDQPLHAKGPVGLAVAPAQAGGFVYVADTPGNAILHYSAEGELLARWGAERGAGDDPGQFRAPEGVAVDREGTVYVADTGNHRIQKFSGDGTPLAMFGGSHDPGAFHRPVRVAVGPDGILYVVEHDPPPDDAQAAPSRLPLTQDLRIKKWSAAGEPLATAVFTVSTGDSLRSWTQATGLAVDAHGRVFVSYSRYPDLLMLSTDLQPLARWGSYIVDRIQFASPAGVTVSAEGMLLLVDDGRHRILTLQAPGA